MEKVLTPILPATEAGTFPSPPSYVSPFAHRLATYEEYMSDILQGIKTFEVRYNDRNFRTGDFLVLVGTHKDTGRESGLVIEARVQYILPGGQFGVHPDYVVLAIKVTRAFSGGAMIYPSDRPFNAILAE